MVISPLCLAQSILINPEDRPESSMDFATLTRELLQTECLTIGFVSSFFGQVRGGYFERGSSDFPFERGLILTTGDVARQSGPNTALDETSAEPFSGGYLVINEILDARLGNTAFAQNIISTSFDFIPQTNQVSFRYIFASESYGNSENIECDNGNTILQDGFAIILKGPGIVPDTYDHDLDPNTPEIEFLHGGKNIALLDDGITEAGLGTIHDNGFCTNPGNAGLYQEIPLGTGAISSDGMTLPLTASSAVVPGEAYSLEIVLANRGDFRLDSSLFIEAAVPALEPDLESAYNICKDDQGNAIEPFLTVDSGIGFPGYEFRWFLEDTGIPDNNVPSLTITEEGRYSLEVTAPSGCSQSYAFVVTSSSPPNGITYEISGQVFSENQNLTINVVNEGNFFYQITGFSEQVSPVFEGVAPGEYLLTVTDINGCGSTTSKIMIVDFPKFFTPNNDGINDFWNIDFDQIGKTGEVLIFDRYGMLVAFTDSSLNGWDGTFNGKPLPSSDYWFVVNFDDGSIFKSHFSLKR